MDEFLSLGFKREDEIDKFFKSPARDHLSAKYIGLGHYMVIGINPGITNKRCYFYGIVGGANGYDQEYNSKLFNTIGNPGTRYYTIDELRKIITSNKYSNIYDFVSWNV
jgi:hypothetical protein